MTPYCEIHPSSVDILKKMVTNVQAALASDDPNLEGDIEVEPIIGKVELAKKMALEDNIPIGERLIQKGKLKDEQLEKGLEKQKQMPEKKSAPSL